MKEHKFSGDSNSLHSHLQIDHHSNLPEARRAALPSLADIGAQVKPVEAPCIVVRGFADLHHFLAWFQIDTPQPLIFPANQGRSIKQDRDCIMISGFADLEDFLAWFAHDGYRRPPVPRMKISAFVR